MRPRPQNLIDIRSRVGSFSKLSQSVNLSRTRYLSVPLSLWGRYLVGSATIWIFLFGAGVVPFSVMAPTGNAIFAAENDAERAQLESQLQELEKQIAEDESTLSGYKQQGKTLQSEIDRLNTKISKLNLQLKAVTLTISQLDKNIKSTQNDIVDKEQNITDTKGVIGNLLQNIYEHESATTIEILLQNPQLSDFFGNLNNTLVVQDNLREQLEKVVALRDELVDKQQTLALQRNDAQALKEYQDSQKVAVQSTKSEKNNLLEVTKGQESKYQQLITEKKQSAADIRSRIFRLLGGGELPFGEAVKIAQVAERATGVRAALILAVLTQESSVGGVIGKNLGKCYYSDPRDNLSGTVMSNKEKPIFLALMAELGLNPDRTPVSCPIVSDGAYGGAMGPAQFMPSTWQLYADRIGGVTGGKPASPFNNLDAFTGTALYLSDGLTGCKAAYGAIFQQEACVAAKYYAGGKWRSYVSVGSYGYRVAERAAGFEDDIEVLNAN
jgi:peptidoglycan hydrolase CwlO-like protein